MNNEQNMRRHTTIINITIADPEKLKFSLLNREESVVIIAPLRK